MTKTITKAETSKAPPPMPVHLVDQTPDGWPKHLPLPPELSTPRAVTLCGKEWDRLHRSPDAPLCDGCGDEFLRRTGFPHRLDRRPR